MVEPPDSRFLTSPLIPAATFPVGLLIGVVVVYVGHTGDGSTGDGGAAAPSAQSASPPSSPAGDTVPADCRKAADRLEAAVKVLRGFVASVRNFDPGEIVRRLNRLEMLDNQTRPLLRQCRNVDVTITASPTPTS